MIDLSKIRELATKLSLMNLARTLDSIKATDKEWKFLLRILRTEQAIRDGNKESQLIKRAHFPFIKTIDEFDFENQQSVSKWHADKLSEPSWIEKGYNVLVLGGAGTGKTHLAVALGLKAIAKSKKVFYTTVNELLFCIKTQNEIKKSSAKLRYAEECDLLIIDELGYTPLDREDMLKLYGKMDSYNKKKSLVVITNRDFEGWAEIFHDEVIATTLLDRLIENCQVLKLTGGSYRLRTHRNIFEIES